MFHIASPEEIKEGKITDVYFLRTVEILRAKGINKRVVAEVWAKDLPNDWSWAVLVGVEECAYLLKDLEVKVNCLEEGTIFHPYEPMLEIEGNYVELAPFETAILGLLCQASGIATAAARYRQKAGDKIVASFGARRMHPAISPMIERGAFIGGCNGVSVIKSAELIEADPMGTMPHALILVMGDTVSATQAFNEVISKDIPLVSLIDTFNDEKFEALRVAEALGEKLFAVRLDTPGSRRGNFYEILREVRWELNLRGFKGVKLFVSGGIEEEDVLKLNPIVDGYGVGTSISAAPVIDFSMDIVEIEGSPLAKRGKISGRKRLLRCPGCFSAKVIPKDEAEGNCECGEEFVTLLKPLLEGRRLQRELLPPSKIREWVLTQLQHL